MKEETIETKSQSVKRILVYLLLNFAMTWLFEFLLIWPAATGANPLMQAMTQLLMAAVMFFPALSVLLTRLLTREGFRSAMLAPKTGKRSIPYFAMGWFGPAVLTAVGACIYFLLFPGSFDPGMGAIRTLLSGQGVEPTDTLINTTVMSQILTGVLLSPLLNFLPCFGEEWGWRGYLLPKLQKTMGLLPTLLLSGVIWGLWHLPITVLGHNYGTGYPGYPVAGILAMCCFCVVTGAIFSYLTIRTGSCIPAVLAHGSLNGFASAGVLFTDGIHLNPFLGPVPTGIIGGSAFIACSVVMVLLLLKSTKPTA